MDRWDLYERTVQDPARMAALLRAVHGAGPRVLGEDFAGSAAIARAWAGSAPDARAIAVDHDPEALARARGERIAAHALDVRSPELEELGPCDVVFAGNFSVGELPTRADLVGWMRRSRARLAPGGLLALDTYGGAAAWEVGARERRRVLPGGDEVRWLWQQREADPVSARVVNALSFRVLRDGDVVLDLPEAFVYRWRLWSAPEIEDALREAGFARVEFHVGLDAAPVEDRGGLAEGFAALVAARAEPR